MIGTRRASWGLALLAGGVLAACASPGMPPGGPVDKDPPKLTGITPDTGSVNVRARSVRLRFDEVVNERSTPTAARPTQSSGTTMNNSMFGAGMGGGQGASTLASMIIVSPGDGRERVTWRRTAIEIEPRGGFRANTTYRVVLLPGLTDLRGNALKEQVDIVFSTGATLTEGVVSGVIFDWVAAKPAAGARVEVFAERDTTLRWTARADAQGRFAVRDLAAGEYQVRGWLDGNNNRLLDPREAFDASPVALTTAASTELYAFVHDTLGPRIEQLDILDSSAVRVKFDRGVAVDWRPDSTTFVLMRADSSVVAIGLAVPAAQFDSIKRADAARADSIKRASDTTAARTDSVTAPAGRSAPAGAAPGAAPAGAAGAAPPRPLTPGALFGRPDSTETDTIPPPKMNRPAPVIQWVIPFGEPQRPGDYRLKIRGVPGLGGHVRPSEREFRIRRPAAPSDSTKAPADSTAARPAARPPRP